MIGVAREDDARRIMEVLPKRMSKYGLTVHPEKTRLVRFAPPDAADSAPRNGSRPEPGHSTSWVSPTTGAEPGKARWVVNARRRRADSGGRSTGMRNGAEETDTDPIPKQYQTLRQKLRGHYAYYGITGQRGRLSAFRAGCDGLWRNWLCQPRSRRRMAWELTVIACERRYPLPPAGSSVRLV